MLLLNRRTNESVTAWVNDHEPLLIRVNEVSPTGSVLLRFEGKYHQVCRTEIFHDFKDRNSEEENLEIELQESLNYQNLGRDEL